jgi:hypothetical protein
MRKSRKLLAINSMPTTKNKISCSPKATGKRCDGGLFIEFFMAVTKDIIVDIPMN